MIQTINQSKNKDRGFTIVELLVVIVVIGILAAITIVSYSGVTSRARTTQAATNAAAAQSVAEAMNSDNGSYPATAASFTSGSYAKLPNGVTVVPQSTVLNSGNGQITVTWACRGASCTNTDGGRITYFDYGTGAVSTTIVYAGNAKLGDTFTNPGT